ncbi:MULTISPECIES: hypothetical protein [unclassified Saccharothrix]|uniref:hypothetical protein n=1 Tax=unclassified Saccharothrix TaxID=2593673 RepID=UPI00307FB8B2
MNFARLLVAHGIVTLAAGVVLIAAPAAIPAAVHVDVPSSAFLVPYMLGAAEIAIAVLSFGGSRLTDPKALRLIATTLIVFHLTTAAVEAYASFQGRTAAGVWINVGVRLAVSALLGYYATRAVSRPAVESRA